MLHKKLQVSIIKVHDKASKHGESTVYHPNSLLEQWTVIRTKGWYWKNCGQGDLSSIANSNFIVSMSV